MSHLPILLDHCDASASMILAGKGAADGTCKKKRREIMPRQADRNKPSAAGGSKRPSAMS